MAERPEVRPPLREVLSKVEDDLRNFAPPRVREQREAIQPTPSLLSSSDSMFQTSMAAVEELEKKVAALRQLVERGMTQVKTFTDEIANQHAQILEQMNVFESKVNQSVERILDIGRGPPDTNSKGEERGS